MSASVNSSGGESNKFTTIYSGSQFTKNTDITVNLDTIYDFKNKIKNYTQIICSLQVKGYNSYYRVGSDSRTYLVDNVIWSLNNGNQSGGMVLGSETTYSHYLYLSYSNTTSDYMALRLSSPGLSGSNWNINYYWFIYGI